MWIIATLSACAVMLVGCANDVSSGTGTPTAPEPTSAVSSATLSQPRTNTPTASATSTAATPGKLTGTVIKSANSQFGMMLFDGTGQAIYLFDKERTTKPECYGACAKAWPPVLTKGTPVAADEIRPSLLGTAERTDGTTQVTYGGHPLYFYAHEAKNEVKCHNIQGFGGLWLVVTPAGRAAAT
jgi:predicted lipoprotein with Yx(FWY)xxD motif